MKTRLFFIAFAFISLAVYGKQADQEVVADFIGKWNIQSYLPIVAVASVAAGLLLLIAISIRKKIRAKRALMNVPVNEFIRKSEQIIPIQPLVSSRTIFQKSKVISPPER